MNILILVRGCSGAGKTTFCELFRNFHDVQSILSTDNYWLDDNGNYNFDILKLSIAHQWNINETEKEMIKSRKNDEINHIIIVNNTFTTEKEMKPYYDLAQKYSFKVFSIIVENRHNGINVHNVPEQALIAQKNRFVVKL